MRTVRSDSYRTEAEIAVSKLRVDVGFLGLNLDLELNSRYVCLQVGYQFWHAFNFAALE